MKQHLLTLIALTIFITTIKAAETDATKISKTFQLGEFVLSAPKMREKVEQTIHLQMNTTNISEALCTVSSVIFANMGGRFEPTVVVSGFDIHGIRVFVDGLSLQKFYNGDTDMGQLATFDYSLVSLTKGSTPMSSGMNATDGSINLISFQPTDKLKLQVIGGLASGNTYEYGVNVGSRWKMFFFQSSYYQQRFSERETSKSDILLLPINNLRTIIKISTMQREVNLTVEVIKPNQHDSGNSRYRNISVYILLQTIKSTMKTASKVFTPTNYTT